MKRMLPVVAIVTVFALASCRPKEQGQQEQNAQPPQRPGAAVGVHAGTVQEVLQATAYTYLRVKEQDDVFWIAVTKRDVNVGDTVSFPDGLEMKDFVSKDLQRTFETVYFVSELGSGPLPSAHDASAPMSHQGKPAMERLELSIERPEGGITIGELFSDREAYAGKTVLIRGQVTKVNRAILGKNWVHLQDGTGSAESYDLTITTLDDAAPGDVVTFEGTIALNRDFGSGYSYEVLMEEARKRDE